jgi:hypothetical protein
MKLYRSAKIDVVPNGFIITIGCQRVVAETPDRLKQLITKYLDNPDQTEKDLLSSSIAYTDNVLPTNALGSAAARGIGTTAVDSLQYGLDIKIKEVKNELNSTIRPSGQR